eukprot:1140743-Pyramimonas_sp.AAC.1
MADTDDTLALPPEDALVDAQVDDADGDDAEEEAEHISVWIRMRPLSAAEADSRISWKVANPQTIQQCSPQTGQALPGKGHTYAFDEVFNSDVGNEE